ncbi:MAG: organic hydroperoxide resistance protein [Frankiaceae bacterium]
MTLRKVLYTAEASTDGGREGVVRSSDGRLEVSLSVPVELRGAGGAGTNPEQLFAAGYAACYQSALFLVAAGRKIDISGSRVTVRVGLGPTGTGGMGLAVQIDLDAAMISPDDAAALMRRAYDVCPYSNATRGNVDAVLSFHGTPL